MIHKTRIQLLNEAKPRQDAQYVLYWMQQSQRTRWNHALEYAIDQANALRRPVVVGFGLMDDYPEANQRHYAFMLEGLAIVKTNLQKRGIQFVLRHGHPAKAAIQLAKNACLVIADRGYLRHQKAWRDEVADGVRCEMAEVETDVLVPVDVVSDHAEFAARTIRPKIHKHWKHYLQPLPMRRLRYRSTSLKVDGGRTIDLTDVPAALKKLKIDRSLSIVRRFKGGEDAARLQLRRFLARKLRDYGEARNDPAGQHTSMLSPYLHFGQISPLEIALAASGRGGGEEAFLEEVIVRRELAMNHANFNPHYDQYDGLPAWARKTLTHHRRDRRDTVYTLRQLEAARTHDEYWNAAQMEMVKTGYMHNYMRMYWGKKIVEWSRTPQTAFARAMYLNNRYFLDGRDPNAFTNIAWLFGLHDRPWSERKIFGNVRYMNAAGLERKFDMKLYVAWVDDQPGGVD